MPYKLVRKTIKIEVFESVTLEKESTGETIQIYPAHLGQRNIIQWNLTDNSRVFNTTTTNYFDFDLGRKILFMRNSDKDFREVWKVVSISKSEREEIKNTYHTI